MNIPTRLISAVGTPLAPDESVDVEGLRAHLLDQWQAGIDGLLVAGTMGLLQLLRDETYLQLVEKAVEISRGRGELLVGAGDCSFVRTRDRIAALNRRQLDGVVVLCPYFMQFEQHELLDYFASLADFSRAPLYLYHLPGTTRTELSWETVVELSQHPNIRGIKCSCDVAWTEELRRRVDDEFRVIVAAPEQVDRLIRAGWREHLDGVFSLAPAWMSALRRSADAGEWETAAAWQQRINALLTVLRKYGVFPVFTALLNARGIGGNYGPRPYRAIDRADPARRDVVMAEPVVQQLLSGNAPPPPKMSSRPTQQPKTT